MAKYKNTNFWFAADHHFNHANIIKYCKRPFNDVVEMNETLIHNHNEVVEKNDIVVVVGDFSFASKEDTYKNYISKLNGNLILLRGSHDKWMGKTAAGFHEIWQKRIGGHYICACHYAMASWPRSHYGSYHVYGHHHGNLEFENKSMDVGVDTNNFYPYSLDEVLEIISKKPETPGLIKNIFDKDNNATKI